MLYLLNHDRGGERGSVPKTISHPYSFWTICQRAGGEFWLLFNYTFIHVVVQRLEAR